MKGLFLILITFFILHNTYGQSIEMSDSIASGKSKNFTIALSLGNNGQIQSILDYFYVTPNVTSNYLHSVNSINFKYNLSIFYSTSKSYFYKLRIGYNIARNKYNFSNLDNEIEAFDSQKIINFNPSFGKILNFNKIEICFGMELPFFIVNPYFYDEDYKTFRYPNGIKELAINYKTTTKISGGYVIGLNSIICLKYHINSHFVVLSELSNGILNANFGKNISSETETIFSGSFFPINIPAQIESETIPYTYKKVYFSNAEISLGLGYKF